MNDLQQTYEFYMGVRPPDKLLDSEKILQLQRGLDCAMKWVQWAEKRGAYTAMPDKWGNTQLDPCKSFYDMVEALLRI